MQIATNETAESVRRGIGKRGMYSVIKDLSGNNYNDIFRKQLIDAKILSSDGFLNCSLLYMLENR